MLKEQSRSLGLNPLGLFSERIGLPRMATPRKSKAPKARRVLVPQTEVFAAQAAVAEANFLLASALTGMDPENLGTLMAMLSPDAIPIAADAMNRLAVAMQCMEHTRLN